MANTAPATPANFGVYISSSEVSTFIGLSGAVKPDSTQRQLIGRYYSQGYNHIFLYAIDGNISGNTLTASGKARILRFVQLCYEWNIRVSVVLGSINNNTLNAIYDFNTVVATNVNETINMTTEQEFWNTSYASFVQYRDALTTWNALLGTSGATTIGYYGHTKVSGDSYGEDFNITGAVSGGATVTFTTSVNHNFIAGGTCELVGVTGFANNPNGQFVMTAAAGNTFQISHVAGAGSYGGGAQVSSVYIGTTELTELQSIIDVKLLHTYSLIPYAKYAQRRYLEFTVSVNGGFIVSKESTTATPPQSNNFSGNLNMGQNSAGVPSFSPKSPDDDWKYIVIDTNALGYVPNQVATTPRYYNADTSPNFVADWLVVFTGTMMVGRTGVNGSRIMVTAGADQSSATTSGIISLSDAVAADDWLPLGSSLSYTWSVVTAPAGFTVATFSNANILNPTFTFNAPGVGNWVLRLTVTDGATTSFDDMTLFIDAVSGVMTLSVVEFKGTTCAGDCDGEALATITGGVAPFTYTWSDGTIVGPTASVTDTLAGLCSGAISCTVTDSTGGTPLTATDSTTITSPPPLVITLTSTNPLCPGGSDGTIQMVITGGSPLGIASTDWTRDAVAIFPADPYNLINLNLGLYEVTVTDNGGCVRTASVNIIEPVAMTVVSVITDTSCFGSSDGTITIVVSGGTGGYTYSWINPVTGLPFVPPQIADKISGLTANSYTVVVTDDNGCVQNFVFVVNDPNPIIVTITPIGVTDFCLDSGQSVDFQAVVTGGGTAPYTYSWSPTTDLSPTTADLATYTPTTSGAYSFGLTVTDANGCQGFASVGGTIFPPFTELPIIQASGVLGSCVGDQITLTVVNSGAFGSLLWTIGGETTTSIIVTAADIYCVIGTSPLGDGCTTQDCIVIDVIPTTIQLIAITDNVCGGNNASGAIDVTTFGGCAPYTWTWTNAAGDTVATTEDVNTLPDGAYTIVATDANGQIARATYVIATSSPSVDITFSNINPPVGGSATAVVTGGTSPYTYAWTDPNGQSIGTGADTITDLFVQGMYTVVITDANGCTASDIVCISNVYSFGMSECEFKCFLQQMSCCQADLVYKMIEADKGGKDNCVQKVELMESYLELLECYYPEGAVVRTGTYAYYVLTINSYSNGGTLVISLLGTEIVNYTFNTGLTFNENLDNIVALVVAAGQTASYVTDGATSANLIINAPAIGSGYNCVTMTVTNTGSNIEVLTTEGFTGGTDTIIADPPCLTDEEILNVIENMKCVCNCDCTNLTTLTADNLNY